MAIPPGNAKNGRSELKTTCAIGGRNFSFTATALADFYLVPQSTITTEFPEGVILPARTTIEIVNEGSADIRVWFKGSAFADGRLLKKGESIAYAVNDLTVMLVRAVSDTAKVQITEVA